MKNVFMVACFFQVLLYFAGNTFILKIDQPRSTLAIDKGSIDVYHSGRFDPEALNCKSFLRDYRNGQVKGMEKDSGFDKSFVTRTNTPKPFFWSTHDPKLDVVRATSYMKGFYYEWALTDRITEVYDAKNSKDGEGTHNDKNMQNKESIFLDVGGNIGWFSLLAAAHGASKVYTFEPNPTNLVRLCESLILNGWLHDDRTKDTVIPIPKGVGSEESTLKFYRADYHNPGSFTFSKERALGTYNSRNMTSAKEQQNYTLEEIDQMLERDGVVGEIDIISLDAFAKRHGWFKSKPSIAFFKLDVEGFEPQIIRGAKKLFRSRLVENFSMEMKSSIEEEDMDNMLEIIISSGYDLYMHGGYMGPMKKVLKKYTNSTALGTDIWEELYKENLLFRRRDDWNEGGAEKRNS